MTGDENVELVAFRRSEVTGLQSGDRESVHDRLGQRDQPFRGRMAVREFEDPHRKRIAVASRLFSDQIAGLQRPEHAVDAADGPPELAIVFALSPSAEAASRSMMSIAFSTAGER